MISQSQQEEGSSAKAAAVPYGGRRREIALGFGVLLLVAAVALRTWFHTRAAAPRSIASQDDLRALVDQDKKPFSFMDLKGRTVVMNFIFTHCPSSCPMQLRALSQIQQALPAALQDRVHFVSVSMDPVRDTPPVLRQYAASIGANLHNWSFVTGDEQEITWLHQYYHVQVKPIEGGLFDHRVIVYLLDATGRLIQKYSGDLDQARLVKEIGDVDSLFNKM
jgi:protein SCO1/2